MSTSGKLLWIKSRMPGLIQDGSSMVSRGLLASVPESVEVDLLTSRVTGREDNHAAASPGPFERIEISQPDNAGGLIRRGLYRAGYALRSHVTRTPRSVFYETGRGTRGALDRMLATSRYGRIIAEYYCLAPVLAAVRERATLVLHDADHVSLAIQAAREPSLAKRLALRYRASQMKSFLERELVGIDRIVTLTKFDRMALEALGLCNVRSVAVPMPPLPSVTTALAGNNIIFLGSLDYLPNRDGLEWFVKEVFPVVRQHVKAARLKIIGAGRNLVYERLKRVDGIDMTGWVPTVEMDAQLADAALTVAPVRLGTGVKTKVLDLMWKGLPVVCTTIASRGTPAENGGAIVADEARDFAAGVVELLSSAELRVKYRDAAWDLLTRDHVSAEAHAATFQTLMGAT